MKVQPSLKFRDKKTKDKEIYQELIQVFFQMIIYSGTFQFMIELYIYKPTTNGKYKLMVR